MRPCLLPNTRAATEVGRLVVNSSKCYRQEMVDKLCRVFGLPCCVKPNRGTGGRGVVRVEDRAALSPALAAALKLDAAGALVEPWLEGLEVACTVHDITQGETMPFPPRDEWSEYSIV